MMLSCYITISVAYIPSLPRTICLQTLIDAKQSTFLNIDAIPMEAVVILKNLEILLDNILNFIPHFDHIISRASKSLGCIIKYCADFKNIHTIKVLRLFVVTWTYSLALTLKFFQRDALLNLDYFHTAESSKSGSTAPHIRLTLSTLKNIF